MISSYSNATAGLIDLATFNGSLCEKIWGSDKGKLPLSTVCQTTPVYPSISDYESTKAGMFGKTVKYRVGAFDRGEINRLTISFILPSVQVTNPGRYRRLRWTRNIAHNLVEYIKLLKGEREVWSFDPISLDFISAFREDDRYQQVIGNISQLIDPTSLDPEAGKVLPTFSVCLPLKLQSHQQHFLRANEKVSNNWTLEMKLRDWNEVLIVDDFSTGTSRSASLSDVIKIPELIIQPIQDIRIFSGSTPPVYSATQLYSSSEITKEQLVQSELGLKTIRIASSSIVHTMYFGVKNTTNSADHSNYSTADPILNLKCIDGIMVPNGISFAPNSFEKIASQKECESYLLEIVPKDLAKLICKYRGEKHQNIIPARGPLERISMFYEETTRLDVMGEFLSYVHPYNVGAKLPADHGYYMYSFGPSIDNVDCATNFSGITNAGVYYRLNELCKDRSFEAFVILHTYHGMNENGELII